MAASSSDLVKWLQETWQRIFTKSPAYFNVWTRIYAFIIVVPQIPALLTEFGVTLPAAWQGTANKIISIAGIVGLLMSKVTTRDATVIASDQNTNKMPFTASKDLSIKK
jgi:hypothetical protein